MWRECPNPYRRKVWKKKQRMLSESKEASKSLVKGVKEKDIVVSTRENFEEQVQVAEASRKGTIKMRKSKGVQL
jgi:hypothetical protein